MKQNLQPNQFGQAVQLFQLTDALIQVWEEIPPQGMNPCYHNYVKKN